MATCWRGGRTQSRQGRYPMAEVRPETASGKTASIDTIDRWLAPLMFYASVLFLAMIAAIMVLWVDIPRVVEIAEALNPTDSGVQTEGGIARYLTDEELALEKRAFQWGAYVACGLATLWLVFVVEQFYRWIRLRRDANYAGRSPYGWAYLMFPPLRLGAHRHGEQEWIWLPRWHWQVVDRDLCRRLERLFSIPMFWISLMILPVLGLQFYFKHRIADYPLLRAVLHIGTGVIWFAFAMEFIVMVSVAKSKWRYCKEHWLDLAIIVLPMVSFLRSIRVLQAMRFVPAAQLGQISKAASAYRMRGVVMRAVRAMMLLDLTTRVLRISPEKRLATLKQMRTDKLLELQEIEAEIKQLESTLRDDNP
ncbi:MAG: potassium channel protein [Pirellulaceae bacterium]|nr:MAG: potassium channel protein [Pirellulaceae bacterium]